LVNCSFEKRVKRLETVEKEAVEEQLISRAVGARALQLRGKRTSKTLKRKWTRLRASFTVKRQNEVWAAGITSQETAVTRLNGEENGSLAWG
jgi:hypothetical protein